MESGWQQDLAQVVIEDGCKARLKGPLGRTRKNTLHADSRSRFSRARPDRGEDLGWEYDVCGEVRHVYSPENSFNIRIEYKSDIYIRLFISDIQILSPLGSRFSLLAWRLRALCKGLVLESPLAHWERCGSPVA